MFEEIEAYHIGGINLWKIVGMVPLPTMFSITPSLDRRVIYMNTPTVVHLMKFSVDKSGVADSIRFDFTPEIYKNENMAAVLKAPMSYALSKKQQEIWCPHDKLRI